MKNRPRVEKKLNQMFRNFNSRFFDGRLNPGIKVFATPEKCFEKRVKGFWSPTRNEIHIKQEYADDLGIAALILLHEMVHADLGSSYVGQELFCDDTDHGMIFKAEIVRLFKAGSYDNLL